MTQPIGGPRKASTQYRSSKYRVARKGGWGFSSYRDVQRSPTEHDEDDMCQRAPSRGERFVLLRRRYILSASSGCRRRTRK